MSLREKEATYSAKELALALEMSVFAMRADRTTLGLLLAYAKSREYINGVT